MTENYSNYSNCSNYSKCAAGKRSKVDQGCASLAAVKGLKLGEAPALHFAPPIMSLPEPIHYPFFIRDQTLINGINPGAIPFDYMPLQNGINFFHPELSLQSLNLSSSNFSHPSLSLSSTENSVFMEKMRASKNNFPQKSGIPPLSPIKPFSLHPIRVNAKNFHPTLTMNANPQLNNIARETAQPLFLPQQTISEIPHTIPPPQQIPQPIPAQMTTIEQMLKANKKDYEEDRPFTGREHYGRKKRVRMSYSEAQLALLERAFNKTRFVDKERRLQLAKKTDLTEKQIKIWFQNRRTKDKKLSGTPENSF